MIIPVYPILNRLVRPVSLVHDGVKFLISRDKEEGGISFEWGEHVGDVIARAVKFAKHNVLVVFQEFLRHLLVSWLKLFAVSTPRNSPLILFKTK